jgi:hypothetical protein
MTVSDRIAYRARLSDVVTGQIADALAKRRLAAAVRLLEHLAAFDLRQAGLVYDTIMTGLGIAADRDRHKGGIHTVTHPNVVQLLDAARAPLSAANVDVLGVLPDVVAAVLRVAAELVDRGPAIPLPPSIISALLREYAEDLEGLAADVTFG